MEELLLGCLCYYGFVLFAYCAKEYKLKREFLLDLIPFRGWYQGLVRRWKKLK